MADIICDTSYSCPSVGLGLVRLRDVISDLCMRNVKCTPLLVSQRHTGVFLTGVYRCILTVAVTVYSEYRYVSSSYCYYHLY